MLHVFHRPDLSTHAPVISQLCCLVHFNCLPDALCPTPCVFPFGLWFSDFVLYHKMRSENTFQMEAYMVSDTADSEELGVHRQGVCCFCFNPAPEQSTHVPEIFQWCRLVQFQLSSQGGCVLHHVCVFHLGCAFLLHWCRVETRAACTPMMHSQHFCLRQLCPTPCMFPLQGVL